MDLEQLCKPVRLVCPSCFKQLTGFKNESGVVKLRCPNCGAYIVSRLMIKTHKLNITVDLPKDN